MSTQENLAWHDTPISKAGEDTLGRGGFVRSAARAISDSWSQEESTVIGLIGPWGSGKTSLINLIESELNPPNEKTGWHIARFTPWSAADSAGVMAEFYTALTAALPEDRAKNFRTKVGSLFKAAAPTGGFIPGVGATVAALVASGADFLLAEKPWDEAFRDASDELNELRVKVLVIVDDIDRLQGSELAEVLRVIRLLGRFPGVQYLLAYDDEVVAQTLASTSLVSDASAASRFLEKIVQYPLRVPPIPERVRWQMIHATISKYLDSDIPRNHFDGNSARMTPLFADMARCLDTARSINRFKVNLRSSFIDVDSLEINPQDLVLLCFLETRFPLIYSALFELKKFLVRDERSGSGITKSTRWGLLEPLLAELKAWERDSVINILSELFPVLVEMTWNAPAKGVSDPLYFDRYFLKAVPVGDVADALVAAAVSEAKNGDMSGLVEVLRMKDLDQYFIAILKSSSAIYRNISDEDGINFVSNVANNINRFSDVVTNKTSAQSILSEAVVRILTRLPEDVSWSDVQQALSFAPAPFREEWLGEIRKKFSPEDFDGIFNHVPSWFEEYRMSLL